MKKQKTQSRVSKKVLAKKRKAKIDPIYRIGELAKEFTGGPLTNQKAKSKAKIDPIFSICELAVNMGPMTNKEMDKFIYEYGH